MSIQCSFTGSILSGNLVIIIINDTKKNPDFILMTLNLFALPFSQSQNSITEICNDLVCLFVCLC